MGLSSELLNYCSCLFLLLEHTSTGNPRNELGVRLDDLTTILEHHCVLMSPSLDDINTVELAVVPVRRPAHENGSDAILFAGFLQCAFEHLAQAIGPFIVSVAIYFAHIFWLRDTIDMCATASAENLVRRVPVGRAWQIQTQPAICGASVVGPHEERKFRHGL